MSFNTAALVQHRNWNLFLEGAAAPVPPVSAYPPAAEFEVLFRYDEPALTVSPIVNSGTYGGFVTCSPSQEILPSAALYGAGGMKRQGVVGPDNTTFYSNTGLWLPVGGSITFGAWVCAVGPWESTSSATHNTTFFPSGFAFAGGNSIGMSIEVNTTVLPANALSIRLALQAFTSGFSQYIEAIPVAEDTWHFVEFCVNDTNYFVFFDGILRHTGTVGSGRRGSFGIIYMCDNVVYGSTDPNNAIRFAAFDNVFVLPGRCVHTEDYTVPGDFT
jgi:hypothetical protein